MRRTIILMILTLVFLLTYSTTNAFWIRRGNGPESIQISDISCNGFYLESTEDQYIYEQGDITAQQGALNRAQTDIITNPLLELNYYLIPRGTRSLGARLGSFANSSYLVNTSRHYFRLINPGEAIPGYQPLSGPTSSNYFTHINIGEFVRWPANIEITPEQQLVIIADTAPNNSILAVMLELTTCEDSWMPDHRENIDAGASAIIYCETYGIAVYYVDDESMGHLSFITTFEELDAIGKPDVNTIVESGPSFYDGMIRLYRLSSGELQINAPKADGEYVYIWDGCERT